MQVAMMILHSEQSLRELLTVLAAFAADYPVLALFAILLSLLCMFVIARLAYNCIFNDYHMGGDWKNGHKVR